MTILVNLSPEVEAFIEDKVANGLFGTASEVIGEALRRMQAEEVRVQAWHAAIKKGDDEIDRGEGIPYTATVLHDITQAALSDMRSGKAMEPGQKP